MKKGEVYKVYEDPFSKTKLEGSAVIIRVQKDQLELDENYFYCVVRFNGVDYIGEPSVRRIICKHDIVK